MKIKIKRIKEDIYGYIYYIHNIENDKYYIGQTTRGFNKRYPYKGKGIKRVYKTLKKDEERGKHISKSLLKDIEKFGYKAFKINKIVDVAFSKEELDDKEEFYIQKFNSIKNGYNFNHGGQGKRNKLDYKKREKYKKATMKLLNKMKKLAEEGNEEAILFLNKREENMKKAYTVSKKKFKKLKKIIKENDTENELYKNEMQRRKAISNTKKDRMFKLKDLAFNKNDENALNELKRILKQSRGVLCVEDNKKFFSAKDAGDYYSLDPSGILKAAKGKLKTCGGYTWKFINF